jgi:hypothetical protein
MFFDTAATSQVYIELFREFVNQLDDQELTLGYYQQDGATSHTSGVSMAEVESLFPRVISRGLWPPRSPDLTPPDFFLWGHLKGRAYMNTPRTLDELRENIRREVLAATFRNTRRHVQLCIGAQGGYFQHLLNRISYRRPFPAPPVTTACKCKATVSGATFKWDALYY